MPDSIPSRLGDAVSERGAAAVIGSCAEWGARYAAGRLTAARTPAPFVFDGHRVTPVHHPYHYTWMNERAVELALALRVLRGAAPERVLEVGNVLAHYGAGGHTVVDRYERSAGVINADAAGFDAGGGDFDLILSVSTLEHVGFDEDPRDPGKVGRAVEHLRGLLAPGGTLWATLPVGYNPSLDLQVRSGELGFDRVRALRRGRGNRWRQVHLDQVWAASYDRLLFTAHGLLVCELRA